MSDLTDIYGKSLLIYAIERGDLDTVINLVANGADIHGQYNSGKLQVNPLECALINGHKEIANFIYEKGANLSYSSNFGFIKNSECKAWIKSVTALDINTKNDMTSLLRAVELHEESYIQKIKDKIATTANYDFGFIDSARFLTRSVMYGNMEILKVFKPEDVNQENSAFKMSYLHLAMTYDQVEAANYIISQGADINRQITHNKKTALMIAIENNNLKAVDMLLDHNPRLDLVDYYENNIMHMAVQNGNEEIIKALYKHDRNAMNKLENKMNLFGHLPGIMGNENVFPEVSQKTVIKALTHYLKSENREIILNQRGNCNALSYLYLDASSRGMRNNFFKTLDLIATWDGTQKSLNENFNSAIRESIKFNNLKEVMEQFISDMIIFQGPEDLKAQYDRLNQFHIKFHIIDGNEDSKPIVRFASMGPWLEYNPEQLKEILKYIIRMPAGTCMEIGGQEHATSLYLEEKGNINYYDPNFPNMAVTFNDSERFIPMLIHTKYHALYSNPSNEKYHVELQLLHFARDSEKFNHFCIFKKSELPDNKEAADKFHHDSPNHFTHLHIALLTGSIVSLYDLLKQNFCDINALSDNNLSVLRMAIESRSSEAALALLENNSLNLLQNNYDSATEAYKNNMTDVVLKIIKKSNPDDLKDVFRLACIDNNSLIMDAVDKRIKISEQPYQSAHQEHTHNASTVQENRRDAVSNKYSFFNTEGHKARSNLDSRSKNDTSMDSKQDDENNSPKLK